MDCSRAPFNMDAAENGNSGCEKIDRPQRRQLMSVNARHQQAAEGVLIAAAIEVMYLDHHSTQPVLKFPIKNRSYNNTGDFRMM